MLRVRWISKFLFRFSISLIGFLPIYDASNNKTICPELCKACYSNKIKGFLESETPNEMIKGCTRNASVTRNNTVQLENNIIFVANEKPQTIYLLLFEKEDQFQQSSTTSLTTKYHFALGSLQSVTWIVSCNFNLYNHVKFSVNQGSSVKDQFTGRDLPETIYRKKFKQGYTLNQIFTILANSIFFDKNGKQEPVNSKIYLKETDILQWNVGNSIPITDENRATEKKCDPATIFDQKSSLLSATFLKPIIPVTACSTNSLHNARDLLYVIDIINEKSNVPIKLELDGIYKLSSGTKVFVVLHSMNPVDWLVTSDLGKETQATLEFTVCSYESTVDTSNLMFDDEEGSVRVRNVHHMLRNDSDNLLSATQAIYVIPISAYSKFNEPLHLTKIVFEENDPVEPHYDPPAESFQFSSNILTECSSSEIAIVYFKDELEEYGIKESQLTFGNGECTIETNDDEATVRATAGQCGMQVAFNRLMLKMEVHTQGTTVPFKLECDTNTDVQLTLYEDMERHKKLKYDGKPSKEIFYVEASMNSNENDIDVSFLLDTCTVQIDKSAPLQLINNNCPTSELVNVIMPHTKEDMNKQFFAFSMQKLQGIFDNSILNINCTVSKCTRNKENKYIQQCPHVHGQGCLQSKTNYEDDQFTGDRIQTTVSTRMILHATTENSNEHSNSEEIPSNTMLVLAVSAFVVGVSLVLAIWRIHLYYRQMNTRRSQNGIFRTTNYSHVGHADQSWESGFIQSNAFAHNQWLSKCKTEGVVDDHRMLEVEPPSSKEKHIVQALSDKMKDDSDVLTENEMTSKVDEARPLIVEEIYAFGKEDRA